MVTLPHEKRILMKRKGKRSRSGKMPPDLHGGGPLRESDASTAGGPLPPRGSPGSPCEDLKVPGGYDAIHSEEFLDADVETLRDLVRGTGSSASDSDCEFEQLGDSGFFSIASLPWEDRLTKSIRQISGWTVVDLPIKNQSLLTPVFSDGVKNYTFDSWKIYVTFRRLPGLMVLDWSPETLEEDIGRAKEIRVPEKYEVSQTARCLLEQFTRVQLQEIWNLISKDTLFDTDRD